MMIGNILFLKKGLDFHLRYMILGEGGFPQEWSKYTPLKYDSDVLDESYYYYRGQQRVRSPPRLGYVRGGPHYSDAQYEVKSKYDQGYARSPSSFTRPRFLTQKPLPWFS